MAFRTAGLRLRGGGIRPGGVRGKADSWASMVSKGRDVESVDEGGDTAMESTIADPVPPVDVAPKAAAPAAPPAAPAGRGGAKAAPAPATEAAAGEAKPAGAVAAGGLAPGEAGAAPGQAGEDIDSYYFNSYSHFGIHEEMLKDEVPPSSASVYLVSPFW